MVEFIAKKIKELDRLVMVNDNPVSLIKESFKPANGQIYYSPEWDLKHKVIRAVESQWSGSCYEWALYMVSLTYETKEDCEENLFKDYYRVTGSEWSAKSI